jgi:hypothetical protein
MQNSQLNRVMQLIKRTGDKMAILDNETDAVLMVMELGAYEKMLQHPTDEVQGIEKLTEEELMEKINKDVALWRAYNDKERLDKIDEEEVLEKKVPFRPMSAAPVEAEKRPIVAKTMPLAEDASQPSQANRMDAEESVADIASEEDEEKFYLEPVE